MFLLIDTADLKEIVRAVEVFPGALAGVTTCPSIIVQSGRKDIFQLLRDIREIIGSRMLHAQVMGNTAEEIVTDACRMRDAVSGEFYPKIPVTIEGFRAMGKLRDMKIPFTATTIHSAGQAFLAAEQGAAFLAPYINHIDDQGFAGAEMVREVAEFLRTRSLPAKLLAASFRNTRQVGEVLAAGAHTVTLSPDIFWKLAGHPMTEASARKFRSAWDSFFGPGKNVANLPD